MAPTIASLAFDAAGTLHGLSYAGDLYRFDLDEPDVEKRTVRVGPTGLWPRRPDGLAFDPEGRLLAQFGSALYRIGTSTGAATFVGEIRDYSTLPPSLPPVPFPQGFRLSSYDPFTISTWIDLGGLATVSTAPTLEALSPPRALSAGEDLELTVTGNGFLPTSVVRWRRRPLPTVFVSETELRATVPADDLLGPATADVTVLNPEGDLSRTCPELSADERDFQPGRPVAAPAIWSIGSV